MPSKRSKSEERNRKIKYRQNRDPAKILLDQEKDRIRKNELKFGQTGEERELEKEAVDKITWCVCCVRSRLEATEIVKRCKHA